MIKESEIDIKVNKNSISAIQNGQEYLCLYNIDSNKLSTDICDFIKKNNKYRLKEVYLIIVEEGEFTLKVNGIAQTLSKSNFFFCTFGNLIEFCDLSQSCSVKILQFSQNAVKASYDQLNLYKNLIELSCSSGIVKLSNVQIEHFISIYNTLWNIISKNDIEDKKLILHTYIDIISIAAITVFKLHSITQKNVVSKQERFFNCFIDLLNKYAKTEREVQFYADKLGITPKYLSTITIEYSGKTASKWIEEYVINAIISLMNDNSYKMYDIALIMNFQSQSFFGRYFKRATGMSPRKYMLMNKK